MGHYNTASGRSALYNNTEADYNTAMGMQALYDISGTQPNNNTALGYNTGRGIVTGDANTIIGANVTGLASDLSNTIIIADGDGNQRIYASSSGNVGIGTTAPSAKLDVAGTFRALGTASFLGTGTTSYTARVTIYNPGVTGQGDNYTHFGYQSASGEMENYIRGDKTYISSPNVKIDGSLGVKMTASAADLAVGGSIAATDWVGAGCEAACDSNGSYALLYSNGNIQITGTAYKPGGGTWTASSDARLKDIDGAYTAGLEQIAALNPVRFHYKKDNPRHEPSDKPFIGLVAQEAMKAMPELVSVRESDGYYDLDASALPFALVNAVKELKAANENLRAEFEAYKAAHP